MLRVRDACATRALAPRAPSKSNTRRRPCLGERLARSTHGLRKGRLRARTDRSHSQCRELLELLHEELVGGGGARSRPRAQHEVRENLAPCAQRPQLDAADLCAPATRSDALREQGGRPSSARGSTASVHMCTGRAGVLQAQLRTSRSAPPASPGWWRRGGGDAMAPAEKRPLRLQALRLEVGGSGGFFDSPSPGFLSTRKRIRKKDS